MAQLVARLVRIEEVRGSNPLRSTEQHESPRLTPGAFVFSWSVVEGEADDDGGVLSRLRGHLGHA